MLDDKTDDPIMISALEHWSYCPRQCALIHVEQTFDENLYTLRGRAVHKRVDEPVVEEQVGVRIERALPLWSKTLGLIGKADVVEFHGERPYPVEYKHGPHREQAHDDLQLCAQALCLEEMTGQPVPRGAIYHHSSRKRREVECTPGLRTQVVQSIQAIRLMLASKQLPPPVNDRRCTHCSLQESCMPAVIDEGRRASAVVRDLFTIHS
ncbi:MAG: CRISPR-associated protein Cas4 [Nitrospira sp. CG24D]|jgi:CRISPR-associated exonuclease Cas4|nr:MAG: CRISPR-associated protein Cas4 [Nitrospira sp. CG24D]